MRSKAIALAIALLSAVPLLFLEAILYAGLTFTSGRNIGFWLRVFLLFGCIFDLPAYVTGIVRPRIAGYWLLLNSTVTLVFIITMETFFWFESRGQTDRVSLGWHALLGWAFKVIAFLLLRVVGAVAFLVLARLRASRSTPDSSLRRIISRSVLVLIVLYCAYWVFYLFYTWWIIFHSH